MMEEEVVRATLIVLNEQNYLDKWPNSQQFDVIFNAVEEILKEDDYDDGQPSWEQEWEDFGEVYSDGQPFSEQE
jgi:hypothetical protein